MLILTAIITTIGLIRRKVKATKTNRPEGASTGPEATAARSWRTRLRRPTEGSEANRPAMRRRLEKRLLQPAFAAAALVVVAFAGIHLASC
ncbi:hypothetical protein [Nocardia sp. NPDC050406]|uniref:hypothetical protein n=1 Tax=Nocardia sp. NPDC050406 TaxID=3364318 RepID=UPI0037ACEDA4